MNIFEDLVEELKEENLLENTVIENNPASDMNKESDADNSFEKESVKTESVKTESVESIEIEEKDSNASSDMVEVGIESEAENVLESDFSKVNQTESEQNIFEPDEDAVESKDSEKNEEQDSEEKPQIEDKPKLSEREFFKQRAIDEVTGLQMVEHVLSGVEREQMKTTSTPYNDIKVKQALHNFLKVANDIKSAEHAKAEFNLMQETEDWYSSLSRRDRNISVAHLRRYCETTKPSLSSQALMALARFYRNSPYSESVRSKFDLIATRLFTKDLGSERRELLFERDELIKHLKELYADWASVPLYSTQEDDSELLLSVLQFQEFVDESKNVEAFDELVKKDFFKRIKVFKEKTNESFFSPQLVAAAVESNVIVGNRYVELIEKERNTNLEEKYGVLHDKAISEATSKTLELVELIKEKKPNAAKEELFKGSKKSSTSADKTNNNTTQEITSEETNSNKLFGVNKWLLALTAIVFVISGVFYYSQWGQAENSKDDVVPAGVKRVNLEKSFLKDHLHKARISKETFFAIAKPSWSNLSDDEKKGFLRKISSLGKEKEFSKVLILDEDGKSLASANKEMINININSN